MKLVRKILVLGLIVFVILGCGHEEGELIEINSDDLLKALVNEEDIVFCTINSRLDNSPQFKQDLEEVIRHTHANIYYIDSNHLSSESMLLLSEAYVLDYYNNTYNVYVGGNFVIDSEYSNYETLFKDLNGKNYEFDLEKKSDEDIQAVLEEASEFYNKGEISAALERVNSVWSSDLAKDFFTSHNYLNIVNEWENYELLDDGMARYTGICIYAFSNSVYIDSLEAEFDGFEVPDITEYEIYTYKIENDALLISSDGKKFKSYAKINYLDDSQLVLEKDGKKLSFLRS